MYNLNSKWWNEARFYKYVRKEKKIKVVPTDPQKFSQDLVSRIMTYDTLNPNCRLQ